MFFPLPQASPKGRSRALPLSLWRPARPTTTWTTSGSRAPPCAPPAATRPAPGRGRASAPAPGPTRSEAEGVVSGGDPACISPEHELRRTYYQGSKPKTSDNLVVHHYQSPTSSSHFSNARQRAYLGLLHGRCLPQHLSSPYKSSSRPRPPLPRAPRAKNPRLLPLPPSNPPTTVLKVSWAPLRRIIAKFISVC